MPNPLEVCTVTIGGSHFRNWTQVAVSRAFNEAVSRATLQIVEPSNGKLTSWGALKVNVGDKGSVSLGGRQVINGFVETRQAATAAAQKGVQVDFVSLTFPATQITAPVKPGEYKKYSFQQIASSMLGEIGVGMRMLGSLPELAKPFQKFNVIPGETIFAAIERLARFRNVFFTDDAEGNLVVGRGAPGSAPVVQEGRNMKSGRLVMSNPWLAEKLMMSGSRAGDDTIWGDEARQVSATAALVGSSSSGVLRVAAEMAGDKDDMKLRADHEVAATVATSIECQVTVQGWFDDGGSLWIDHVGKGIMIVSDTLFPTGRMNLKVRQVSHTQDAGQGGTETQIVCCHEGGLGSGPKTNAGTGPSIFNAQPAKPDGDEQ